MPPPPKSTMPHYLLAGLIVFFLTLVGFILFDRSTKIIFDEKGILTGPGSFLSLLAASLLALIFYVIFQLYFASVPDKNSVTLITAPEPAPQPPTFLGTLLGCLVVTFFAALPLGVVWIGIAFLCAKFFGMGAGMTAFFVPVLLMAVFVFTRPAELPEQTRENNEH